MSAFPKESEYTHTHTHTHTHTRKMIMLLRERHYAHQSLMWFINKTVFERTTLHLARSLSLSFSRSEGLVHEVKEIFSFCDVFT